MRVCVMVICTDQIFLDIISMTFHVTFFLKKIVRPFSISLVHQGLSIERVKNLYHMLKTLVGQCCIYLHTKSTFKIYDKC